MPGVTVFRRGGRWWGRWWDPGLKKIIGRSLRTDHYPTARRKAKELEEGLEDGSGRVAALTVAAMARRYISKQAGRVSAGHLQNQRRHIRVWLKECPVRSLAEVTPAVVRDFLDGIGGKGATVNRYRSTLRSMFELAVEDDMILVNPVRKSTHRPEERHAVSFLTREEATRTLDAIRGTTLYLPVLLGIYAGLRRGEVCGLRWDDVDLDGGRITVRRVRTVKGRIQPPKSRQERIVPLHDTLRQALKEARRDGPWIAWHRGRAWTPAALSMALRRAGRRLRIKTLTGPHVLRKTFGSWLAMAGEPLAGISRMLGHSSVVVTERHYAALEPGRRGKIDEL